MSVKYFGLNSLARFWNNLKARLDLKYDKTGGEITGDVKIDGNLTLDIEDEDYDSGITFSKSLDANTGTILTLTGYANANNDNTNYRPVIRNIASPVNNYDVANKLYVDSQVQNATLYLVLLDANGDIDTVTSTLTYAKVKADLTNPTAGSYLDVIFGTSRFYVKALQDMDTNNGPIKFVGSYIGSDSTIRTAVFTLDSSNNLTVNHVFMENWNFKVQDVVANASNNMTYPSTAAVYNQFQRKPVIVWEVTDTTQGLKALQTDIAAAMSWQLTGLDLTPFKRIKIYSCGGQGSTNAGTTGAMVLEMSLDSRMAITTKGGHYVGSVISQKPNDANRYASLTCAVSADKTSFAVLRQTSLYGTAATTNNDIGANVVLIEGYYD